jgi:hypothetical protein
MLLTYVCTDTTVCLDARKFSETGEHGYLKRIVSILLRPIFTKIGFVHVQNNLDGLKK